MNDDELAKLVNRSGFLFQVAVEEHIRATADQHGWDVLAREHPWMSTDGARGGFIDFVAGRSTLRCVVDCKRTQGGEWIFLLPKTSPDTFELRTLWSYRSRDKRHGFGWADLPFEPATPEAAFCIVRGASDEDKPMLERIAGDLVKATESLAREELGTQRRGEGPYGYIPVIVTNAKLFACRVNLSDVQLEKGALPPSATFQEVVAIRFRKALSSDIKHEPENYDNLKEGLDLKQRSTIVVTVGHLTHWLGAITQREAGLSLRRNPWWQLES